MIDAKDREILTILQGNARISNAEIARQVGMAPSAILERIRRMEASGVIQGYETRVSPEALGYHLLAFVFVATNDFSGELRIAERLGDIPEVQEVHHIAGEDCFLVKVRARDAKSLGRLLREQLGQLRTRTTVVLETICQNDRLPLDGPTEEDRGGVS
jgi:Lrp/AsnC family transcriptional regulator, leucine-responsive regulatory protein